MHERDATDGAATRLTLLNARPPLDEAVIVAMESLENATDVAEKVAEVPVAATVTAAGTMRAELLLERVTLAPAAGAGWLRVTVQVLEAFGPRLLGLQATVEAVKPTITATRFTLVLVELLL